jgi:methylated-DNA-[protein]-cysteine S-methyltransferase
MKYCRLDTPMGALAVGWDESGVKEILLPGWPDGVRTVENGDMPDAVMDALDFLKGYFQGAIRSAFPGLRRLLDAAGMHGLRREVMERAAAIPYGETMSYGDVAASLGHPRAARAVGNFMASNPFPILVPCHRVVLSSGRCGRYRGGSKMKESLLLMERRMLE